MVAINPQAQILSADHPLREVNGALIVNLGQIILVESKSRPGDFHTVVDGTCSCIGFSGIPGKFDGYGHCRHTAIAAAAMELDRVTAQPVSEPELVWMGNDHGFEPRYREACESCDRHVFTATVPTREYGPLRLCWRCSGAESEQTFRESQDA